MAKNHCVFRSVFVRDQIDPRVKALWEKTTGQKAPFGRLRMNFQRQHCRSINPYGSETCPFTEEECGLAFLAAVQNSLLPWIKDPAAYFVQVAHSGGIERADHKPLARELHRETRSGNAGDAPVRLEPRPVADVGSLEGEAGGRAIESLLPETEDHLRRAARRPESIGSLLGSLHVGSHPWPERDGRGQAEGQK